MKFNIKIQKHQNEATSFQRTITSTFLKNGDSRNQKYFWTLAISPRKGYHPRTKHNNVLIIVHQFLLLSWQITLNQEGYFYIYILSCMFFFHVTVIHLHQEM